MFTLPAIVTAAALILYQALTYNVGRARMKHGIHAPATTGSDEFDRVYRVQMNTLEQLGLFIPSLWLFAYYVDAAWAGALGLLWILSRILYAHDYYIDAKKRMRGFVLGLTTANILLIGGIIGALMQSSASGNVLGM